MAYLMCINDRTKHPGPFSTRPHSLHFCVLHYCFLFVKCAPPLICSRCSISVWFWRTGIIKCSPTSYSRRCSPISKASISSIMTSSYHSWRNAWTNGESFCCRMHFSSCTSVLNFKQNSQGFIHYNQRPNTAIVVCEDKLFKLFISL